MNESDTGRWETIYPASPAIHTPSNGFEEFTKLYTTYFWNQEEYIMRYLIQNINIHSYLNSHNIKHIFLMHSMKHLKQQMTHRNMVYWIVLI